MPRIGDEKAFTELMITLEKDMYKIARTRFNDINDIEEVVQDTMIQAFKSIKKLKDSKKFKNWLFKVLINKSNLLYKKKKQTIEYKNSMERDWYYSTENIDSRLDFMYLIKDLNYDEKITITLFYLEDFTSSEIAKILKESESTIRNRLSRARRKIKENMEGDLING